MLNSLTALLPDFYKALLETLYMMSVGLTVSVCIGLPLGVLLFLLRKDQILENKFWYALLGGLVNIIRSFPFAILIVALIPLTRTITGTTIGPTAATFGLVIALAPYFSRLVEQSLLEIPKGLIEAVLSMGATPLDLIRVLLIEARSSLVLNITTLAITFLSFTAVAGIVGGGGLGDLAIRYGYYRFETDIMIITVLFLIGMVQIIQFLGTVLAKAIDHK